MIKLLELLKQDKNLIESLEQGFVIPLEKYSGILLKVALTLKNNKDKLYDELKNTLNIKNDFKQEFNLFYDKEILPLYKDAIKIMDYDKEKLSFLKRSIFFFNIVLIYLSILMFIHQNDTLTHRFEMLQISYINVTLLYFLMTYSTYKLIIVKDTLKFRWHEKLLSFLSFLFAFLTVPIIPIIKMLFDVFLWKDVEQKK